MSRSRTTLIHSAAALAILLAASTGVMAQKPPTAPDFTFESNQADALLGNFVSSAGDVNGDGYGDVFVSAPRFDNGETDEGRIYLFLGSATGLGALPAWTFESDQADAQARPASAGDVDGDGYDDAIVGAGLYDDDQVDEGRAWIFRGGPAGLETTPIWFADGDQTTAVFGGAVAAAGDVNGDGYEDVLVGAAGYDNGEADEGAAFLYFGSPTGPSTTADFVAEGNQAVALFGRVAAAGDVNADGFDDFLIGSQFFDDGEQDEGAAFLYLGSAAGPGAPAIMLTINEANALFGNYLGTAGDVNGDGFGDIVVAALGFPGSGVQERVFVYHGNPSGVSLTPDQVLQADQSNTQFGIGVGTAGDVNGDGFDDVIVGARLYDVVSTNEGRAFVYAGSRRGLKDSPLRTYDGSQAFEELGVDVAGAGDVNGDGFGDIVIGAHAFDNPENNEGRALVFHGKRGR